MIVQGERSPEKGLLLTVTETGVSTTCTVVIFRIKGREVRGDSLPSPLATSLIVF